jgi:peptide-methionine (R)-S-oxide reductase
VAKIEKTDSEWRKDLTPAQYHVLREKGTEPPFSGKYKGGASTGRFLCAGCGMPLFAGETKYDSGSGWPSFYQPLSSDAVKEHGDMSHGMVRTEVMCAKCGGHLGHVFPDGPRPTGLRYCINALSLQKEGEDKP